MLSTRDPLQTKGQIQTESEGMEKDIPCKQKSKESWSSNTHINKIDFKIKNVTTEGRTLRNDQGNNPRRRYNNYKCMCIYAPNIGAPQYIRQMLTVSKEEIDSNTVIVGAFCVWLSLIFVAVCGLSLVVVSKGYSSLQCTSFSL